MGSENTRNSGGKQSLRSSQRKTPNKIKAKPINKPIKKPIKKPTLAATSTNSVAPSVSENNASINSQTKPTFSTNRNNHGANKPKYNSTKPNYVKSNSAANTNSANVTNSRKTASTARPVLASNPASVHNRTPNPNSNNKKFTPNRNNSNNNNNNNFNRNNSRSNPRYRKTDSRFHKKPFNKNRIFVDFKKIDLKEIESIFATVLKRVTPSEKKILKEVNEFITKINYELKKNNLKAVAVLGGSIAKGTNLKGDHDCDIFVKFDVSYKNYDISSLLLRALRPFRPNPVHGSRDYFQIMKTYCYEIVPVLDISIPEDAVNVTDMSPMHVTWVANRAGYTKDIRLAKMFCKSQKVYGAESYIQGFSGHVLDILTIHYKGFVNLLKASLGWSTKEVVDAENYFKGKPYLALKELNISKLDSPLVVIDPVLKDRNAAAALSLEKFELFRQAAKNFLTTPSKSFFKLTPITIPGLKKDAGKNSLVILESKPLEGKSDVVGAKLLKVFTSIKNQVKFNDFELIDCGWEWNKTDPALFWFVFPPADISSSTTRIGPPLSETFHVEDFKRKHAKTFEENGRICADVKRDFKNPISFIRNVVKTDELILDKVKKIVMKRL
ncbi:hypothetical protein HN587_05350 [Candidatus Woesearchaeota archaeon]|jgi:tRNA nucleotidyltransferase (CCA-adding enzyme)|nr:hypothetical protein [Candidatus Woesearchaeota archaeon]